jgi:DNA-binding NarL/FixJ family response regulator
VLMDVTLGGGANGADLTRQILTSHPGVKVIALSGHASPEAVIAMLDAGAGGYVLKGEAYDGLVGAMTAVLLGGTYVSPDLRHDVARMRGSGTLSPREREVLRLVADGNSVKEAAFTLGLSNKTVETHRRNIMGKLGIFSVAELTKHAIRAGLTTAAPGRRN